VAAIVLAHVLPQLLVVWECEPLLDDGLVEAVGGGHHPHAVLGEGGDELRRLPAPHP
jgi:hypothetical protein